MIQNSICKGCGASIVWIRTPNGKKMPCDQLMVRAMLRKGGRKKFILPNGEVVSGDYARANEYGAIMAYETHWASCKAAKQFRKGEQYETR